MLRFTDGVELDTSGDWRCERHADGCIFSDMGAPLPSSHQAKGSR
jgi:hypothetical protein